MKKFLIFLIVLSFIGSTSFALHYNKYTTNGRIPTNKVTAVDSNDKYVFLGTDKGLYIIEPVNSRIYGFTEKDGLASDMITCLAYSETAAKLFIGTNKGLSIYSPTLNKFKNYSAEEGLPDNDIRNIFADNVTKKVYVSTFGGKGTVFDAADMDSIDFEIYQTGGGSVESLSSLCISSYLKDSKGSIWHGTNGKGIFISDKDMQWESFAEYKLENQWITGIAYDQIANKVYISSTTGVVSVNPDQPEFLNEIDVFKGVWVKHLICDNGNLLVATKDGLFLYMNGQKYDLAKKYFIRSAEINKIKIVNDTVLIATEDNGVYVLSFPIPEDLPIVLSSGAGNEKYDKKTFIVRYEKIADLGKLKSIASSLGFSIKDTEKKLKAILFSTTKEGGLEFGIKKFNDLASKAGLQVKIGKNALVRASFSTSDPFYTDQKIYLDLVNCEKLWDSEYNENSDEEVIVAVLDTGVNKHADLIDNLTENGKSFVSKNPNDELNDLYGHGTQVAGIIAAMSNNSLGIKGLSSNVKIMSVKVMGDNGQGNSWLTAKGIRYAADNGADVINMSLGGSGYCDVAHDAVKYATEEKGCAVIAAAGNDNSAGNHYPSAFPEVISVVAVDYSGKRAKFSNFGNQADVSAPGVRILSTTDMDEYNFVYGTSFAAPVVSALTAILKQNKPSFSADEIHSYLIMSCGPGGDTSDSADGVKRTEKSGKSKWKDSKKDSKKSVPKKPSWKKQLGFGIIDFYKAVDIVNTRSEPTLSHLEVKTSRIGK